MLLRFLDPLRVQSAARVQTTDSEWRAGPGTSITDMRFVCAGAGSAGLGVCAAILKGMVSEGMAREEAVKRFIICDNLGAIGTADGANGDPHYPALLENGADACLLLPEQMCCASHELLGVDSLITIS